MNLEDEFEAVATLPPLSHQLAGPSQTVTPPTNLEGQNPSQIVTPPADREGQAPSKIVTPAKYRGVPSPFKRHLFYAKDDMTTLPKKRAPKEKMPSIVSGKSYQEYLENKLQKKEEMDKAKMERAAERERKKKEEELKTKAKKPRKTLDPISCSSTESSEEGEEDEEGKKSNLLPAKKEVGEFLAFKYEGKVFAGKVVQLDERGPVISAMKPSGKLWKWPVPPDILNYSWADVIGRVKNARAS